ncbi:hypothetical protein Tco_0272319 [Tanacetum coccineum]
MTEAYFEDEQTTTTIINPNDLNIAIPDQVFEESILYTPDKVEITSDNDARDQACEVKTNVLVDGKQDDAKVVKVVGVAVEQSNDEPNVLEGNGVIGVGVNEINKWVDKEVQYSVSTLYVLISLLKCLNEKNIKKKKMKAEIQRRIWNPGIKINFFRHHLEDKVVSKEWRMLRPGLYVANHDELKIQGESNTRPSCLGFSGLCLALILLDMDAILLDAL